LLGTGQADNKQVSGGDKQEEREEGPGSMGCKVRMGSLKEHASEAVRVAPADGSREDRRGASPKPLVTPALSPSSSVTLNHRFLGVGWF
jgi:hypothetical protein